MFMVKPDHIVIRLTEVCPPGIYLDIGRKQILAMLINGALDDLVAYAQADSLLLTVDCRIGNILPAASNVYGFPLTGMTDILTAVLYLFEPSFLCFAAAHVPFDDKPGAILNKDPKVFGCIISGIHAD